MTARTRGFERHRSLLFSIAYRMLGSSARQRADVEALLGDVYADDVAADGARGTFFSSLAPGLAGTGSASVALAQATVRVPPEGDRDDPCLLAVLRRRSSDQGGIGLLRPPWSQFTTKIKIQGGQR